MTIKVIVQTSRPSFLILTPICVLLGLSTSIANQETLNFPLFFMVLIGATCAHISVNMLNEYCDFASGLDFKTVKTKFSGGSDALPNCPDMAKSILLLGLVSLMVTVGIGIYFILNGSYSILPIGVVGVVLIVCYTPWINRLPLLCLIAPGLGFGTLMVVGAHVIFTGEHSLIVWLISLVPFLLINNLLLLNQYPDMKADKSVGRHTFPIDYGVNKSNLVYAAFMILAYSLIIVLIIGEHLPIFSIIAVFPMVFSLVSLSGMIKWAADVGNYPKYLAANVAAAILTPLLLSLSIIVG